MQIWQSNLVFDNETRRDLVQKKKQEKEKIQNISAASANSKLNYGHKANKQIIDSASTARMHASNAKMCKSV